MILMPLLLLVLLMLLLLFQVPMQSAASAANGTVTTAIVTAATDHTDAKPATDAVCTTALPTAFASPPPLLPSWLPFPLRMLL